MSIHPRYIQLICRIVGFPFVVTDFHFNGEVTDRKGFSCDGYWILRKGKIVKSSLVEQSNGLSDND